MQHGVRTSVCHWQWLTVAMWLFLDRKRNRKRVQSRTGRPAGECSGEVTGRCFDTGAADGGGVGWDSGEEVSDPALLFIYFLGAQQGGWCRWCKRVRVSFKAAPLPWSHLLDSSCLNTTHAPIRIRETPCYNPTPVFCSSSSKPDRTTIHVCWACVCARVHVWTHTISAFYESRGPRRPPPCSALALAPPGRM